MRFFRQTLIGVFLTAMSIALLSYAVFLVGNAVQSRLSQETRAPEARERVFAVRVLRAELETLQPVLQSFGEIRSRRTLELRAAVGGRVINLAEGFQDGREVAAGDLLIQIDPADADAALERARADVLDAQAEVRDAERGLGLARDEEQAAQEQADLRNQAFLRQQDLARRGVATAAAVETAELAAASARQALVSRRQAIAQAEARVDQAQTRLLRARVSQDEAERVLRDTSLTAPFTGVLSAVNVVEGRLVSANEKLADIVDDTALEVAFRVSTAQYTRLLGNEGNLLDSPVTVRLDVTGIDLTAQGKVNRANAAAGTGQTGRFLFAQLETAPGFKVGDFVTVEIKEPPLDNVIRLPASAVNAAGDVLVLGEEDRLEIVSVDVLRLQGDDVLVLSEALRGRDVVESQSPLLGPGIRVRPVRPSQASMPDAPEMLELTEERRARLVALVQANDRMPADAKDRILSRLKEPKVPAQMVARIESRMGG